MINIILLHSNRPSIGKSTFAEFLMRSNHNMQLLSFAKPIKELAYDFYCLLFKLANDSNVWPISYSDFKQDMKDLTLSNSIATPRDITIDISEIVQKIYGSDIWARLAYQDCVLFNQKLSNTTFIFDDWRRPNESEYFSNKENINLIKVFLSKQERRQKERLSDTSESYEGLIKPEDADIVFEFNEDWSNSDQLKELILNAII